MAADARDEGVNEKGEEMRFALLMLVVGAACGETEETPDAIPPIMPSDFVGHYTVNWLVMVEETSDCYQDDEGRKIDDALEANYGSMTIAYDGELLVTLGEATPSVFWNNQGFTIQYIEARSLYLNISVVRVSDIPVVMTDRATKFLQGPTDGVLFSGGDIQCRFTVGLSGQPG